MAEVKKADPTQLEQQAMLAAQAYKASLTYVRYALSGLALVTAATFVAQYNSRSDNWLSARLHLARTALQSRAWEVRPNQPKNPEEQLAQYWAMGRDLRTEGDIREQIQILEAARADRTLRIQLPFSEQGLDINDLGLLSGLSSLFFTIFLSFAAARHSEALYLALWKVTELWHAEGCPDDPNSRANAVYHDLAMAEIFNNPPTIARWKASGLQTIWFAGVVPLSVQIWLLRDSINSFSAGLILQPRSASLSLVVQSLAVGCSLVFSALCLIYGRANDRRFHRTFFSLNKRLSDVTQTPWFVWVELRSSTKKSIPNKVTVSEPSPVVGRIEATPDEPHSDLSAETTRTTPASTGQPASPSAGEA